MRIWIDNDGCPHIVRELVYAAAQRKNISVTVVANSYSKVPPGELFSMICVPGGFDVADDYIAEHVLTGDLVITSDVPLAARIVAKGALGINSHGTVFDERSTGELLATRNLMQELRGGGMMTSGPPPFAASDKKKFADALDRLVSKLTR